MSEPFTVSVPDGFLDAVAERAAEIVLSRLALEQAPPDSPFLSVDEAAAYLRSKRHRVYDLLSSGRLTRHKDGSRVLVSRAELDAHLASNGVAHALPTPARSRMTARAVR